MQKNRTRKTARFPTTRFVTTRFRIARLLLASLSALALLVAHNAPTAAQDADAPAASGTIPSTQTPPASNAADNATKPTGSVRKQRASAGAASNADEAGRRSVASQSGISSVKREPIKEPVTAAGCKGALAPGKSYFVEFRSRTAASYGHTFVFFGQLGGGNRFANFKVAGLHPKGDDPSTYMQGHWMPVEAETGVSYGDLDEQYLTARFCVTLNQAEYTRAVAYIRNLQATTKKWHATTYNCNSFAADIAKAIGLDAPNPNAYLPDVFIKRLAELNRDFNGRRKDSSAFSFPSFSSLLGGDAPRR